jgi:hypothetical protein
MIPEHCIKKFEERFNTYPSIIEISKDLSKTDVKKFFSKSQLFWFKYNISDEGKKVDRESFFEYDPSGIMIYINKLDEIFILTTIDRAGVAEYMINTLKKTK